jgi:carbamoyltransferase
VVCILSEERVCRIKAACGWPAGAIEHIIKTYLDGDVSKIDMVALDGIDGSGLVYEEFRNFKPYKGVSQNRGVVNSINNKGDKKALKQAEQEVYKTITQKILNTGRSLLRIFPQNIEFFIINLYFKFKARTTVWEKKIAALLGVDLKKIFFVHHHICHNTAAFNFIDDGRTYLMFSVDGYGDSLSSSVAVWNGREYTVISKSPKAASLGFVYSGVTEYLGMKPNEHEFKVMGMAPYAHSAHAKRIKERVLDKLVIFGEDGAFHSTLPFNEPFIPIAKALRKELAYERFDNISAAAQLFIEEKLVEWVKFWIEKTGVNSITLSGGVMMNVKAAKKLYELPEVKEIFVTPSSGDESLPLGLLYYANAVSGTPMSKITDLYLGRLFDDQYIESFLESLHGRYTYEKLNEDEMARRAARLLYENKIVARCAGREEWGARALGNRSILCDAAHYENIEILNQYIKSRDFWMPFTPSILEEDIDEYIVNPKGLHAPYMCVSFDSTRRAQKEIPAALHPRDKTVRPQAVSKTWNPSYYKIIAEFKKLTGRGALLNTSFNLHGEPNVGSPEDAIHTLDNSKLEFVILGSYLVQKI